MKSTKNESTNNQVEGTQQCSKVDCFKNLCIMGSQQKYSENDTLSQNSLRLYAIKPFVIK